MRLHLPAGRRVPAHTPARELTAHAAGPDRSWGASRARLPANLPLVGAARPPVRLTQLSRRAAVQPFEDEETRAFYEDLVDLRAYVPAVLLGTPDAAAEASTADVESEPVAEEGTGPEAVRAEPGAGGAAGKESPPPEAGVGEQGGPDEAAAFGGPDNAPILDAGSGEAGLLHKPNELQAMLARLPVCVSREEADEAALAFCYAQSKAARKRLVKALCDVPGGALALLPFFARIVATLGRIWPDISAGEGSVGRCTLGRQAVAGADGSAAPCRSGARSTPCGARALELRPGFGERASPSPPLPPTHMPGVGQHMELEFRQLQKRKDVAVSGRNMEARIRNMRYIGEDGPGARSSLGVQGSGTAMPA